MVRCSKIWPRSFNNFSFSLLPAIRPDSPGAWHTSQHSCVLQLLAKSQWCCTEDGSNWQALYPLGECLRVEWDSKSFVQRDGGVRHGDTHLGRTLGSAAYQFSDLLRHCLKIKIEKKNKRIRDIAQCNIFQFPVPSSRKVRRGLTPLTA